MTETVEVEMFPAILIEASSMGEVTGIRYSGTFWRDLDAAKRKYGDRVIDLEYNLGTEFNIPVKD